MFDNQYLLLVITVDYLCTLCVLPVSMYVNTRSYQRKSFLSSFISIFWNNVVKESELAHIFFIYKNCDKTNFQLLFCHISINVNCFFKVIAH